MLKSISARFRQFTLRLLKSIIESTDQLFNSLTYGEFEKTLKLNLCSTSVSERLIR